MRRSRLAVFTFFFLSLPVKSPAWPSLQAQLEADRVPPGSALERLIAANQDFDLLRSSEVEDQADDRLPVPAWLRVLWRKNHPGSVYPFVLKEIHEWMVSHPDLVPGEREPDSLPLHVFPGIGASVPLPNLRISGRAPNPRSESDIQVFELDPRRIVAASNNVEGSGRQAQYWSTDGGATVRLDGGLAAPRRGHPERLGFQPVWRLQRDHGLRGDLLPGLDRPPRQEEGGDLDGAPT